MILVLCHFRLVRAVHNISFDSRYTPGIVNSIYELQPHDSKPSALYSNDSKADGHYICGEELCLVLLCNEMKERGASMWVFLFHVGANEVSTRSCFKRLLDTSDIHGKCPTASLSHSLPETQIKYTNLLPSTHYNRCKTRTKSIQV